MSGALPYGDNYNKRTWWDGEGWHYGEVPKIDKGWTKPFTYGGGDVKPPTGPEFPGTNFPTTGTTGKTSSGSDITGEDYPTWDYKMDMSGMPKYSAPKVSNAPTYQGGAYRDLPTYTAPAWNQNEINELAQIRAASGLRGLTDIIRRSVNKANYRNPQVARMTLREALEGYGRGAEQVISAAQSEAASEYGQKYNLLSANAKAEFTSKSDAVKAYNEYEQDRAEKNFQGSFAEWQAENEAKQDAARLGYEGRMGAWKMGKEAELQTARANFEERAKEAAERRGYRLDQKALDDAWERWKKEFQYKKDEGIL